MATTLDPIKDQYNKFYDYPDISYNCISYLVKNNETIWKLLKYTDATAWNKTNLTQSEKAALIYKGDISTYENARVFMDQGIEDSLTSEICILRVTPIELYPSTYVYGNVSITFEVYCHWKINHLSNYKTRLDMISQQIIETMNGAEIGSLGRLYFDARASSRCRMTTIGSIPFKGRAVIMCNYIT